MTIAITKLDQFDAKDGEGGQFRSGDKVFTKFKLSLHRNSEGDQSQGLAEGSAEILGGVGKFEYIKGSVTFTGQLGPAGGIITETWEIEY